MTSIKFITNLPLNTENNTPWLFDKKHLDDIPDKPGVYIVGVKIQVNGQGEKFCPLYVGIMDNLRTKIKGHWDTNNKITATGELNSFKEIFDLSCDITLIYKQMKLYDEKNEGKKSHAFLFNSIKNLVWFNNQHFFNNYLKLTKSNSTYSDGKGHTDSIKAGGDLDRIATKASSHLKKRICDVKEIYTNKYFYVYSQLKDITQEIVKDSKNPLYSESIEYNKNEIYKLKRKNGPGKTISESVEHATKEALKLIGIYTTAKSNSVLYPMEIDLSDIQNDLVNLVPIPNNYIKPLIITIPCN